MPHVSDFTQSQDKIILDLINDTNDSELTLAQVDLSDPVPQEDEQVQVTVTPKEGSGYTGSVNVFYNRLNFMDFSMIFFPAGLTIQLGEATMISDLLPQINAAFGVALSADDIVDGPITGWSGEPNEILPVPIEIQPTSLVYYLGTYVMVDGNDIPLSSVITSTILSGMSMPVIEEEGPVWTRYRLNSEMQENPGTLTFGFVSEDQITYRIDDGAVVTLPAGASRAITVPAGTHYLDLSNTTSFSPDAVNSQTSPVMFEAIEYFQETAHPVINFSKGQFFTEVPSNIPTALTNLTNMFRDAQYFNQDISGWNVGHVSQFVSTFQGANTFNQPIGSWNVSAAVTMANMFIGTNFNQDISGWNVGGLANAAGMFSQCGFNQDISNWMLVSVTTISGMFFQNEVFNQDLSSWDLTHLTDPMSWFNYDTDTFSWVLPRPVFGGV